MENIKLSEIFERAEQLHPDTKREGESLPKPISKAEKEDESLRTIDDLKKIDEIKRGLGITPNKERKKSEFLEHLPRINGSIDLSQLKKIGKGGTHDVYSMNGNSHMVLKINRGVLHTVLKTGHPKIEGALLSKAKQYIDSQNNGYSKLYDAFSEENSMTEDVSIQRIKLEDGREIECVVVLQEGSNLFGKADTIDFNCANSDSILNQVDSDNEFENCVRDFLLRFENYINSTDNYIDLVGEKNVLMYKDGGKWRFKLGSVIKGDTRTDYSEAKRKIEAGEELSEEELNHYENGKKVSEFLNKLSQKVLGRDVC